MSQAPDHSPLDPHTPDMLRVSLMDIWSGPKPVWAGDPPVRRIGQTRVTFCPDCSYIREETTMFPEEC